MTWTTIDNYLFIEIDNHILRQYGRDEAIKNGYFMIWDKGRIKRAFAFGNGTMKDFNRFMKDNKQFCSFHKMKAHDVNALFSIEYI